MKKQKEYKRALQKYTVLCVPLAPTTPLFTMLSPIYFYFSGVYNVISAEVLTRSLSFIGSAGKIQSLSKNLFFIVYYNFLLFFLHLLFLPGKVPLLCEWATKATKDKH